ncbi:PREDICTED: uncharacterized protein LOC105969329 [Erythranthe guttata]|uniref:uncharacterized protein LOC105969329 n=1 Tax=Erythranthe guttata TaxID=4155 RepID=UPI00064D744B|nr:PREDICTED: uncharacterized protein LOC105969329 [Erythranthe guttata]|eukprot:XP_012849541.1 PREDICTED: uncharacterized protein LOC105969329 [Erythranthe guttata]
MEEGDTTTRNLQKELDAAARDTPTDPSSVLKDKSGCSLVTPEKEGRIPFVSGSPSFEFQSGEAASRKPVTAPAQVSNERTYTRDEDGTSTVSNLRRQQSWRQDGDPAEHLSRFNNTASLHQLTEGVKCRAFVTTLAGPAQAWFGLLPPGSIHSFGQFAKAFMNQFTSSKKCKKTSLSLFSIRQKEKESLRNYIKRFTSATLEVPTTSDEVLMAALSQGLRDDEFFRALALEPSPDFDNLLERASRFINLEEARQQKIEESHHTLNVRANEARKSKEPVLSRRDTIPGRGTIPDAKGSRYQSYQPLTAPLSQVLCAIEKRIDLRWPRTAREEPRRNPALGTFCRFHNEYGHVTDDCSHLKDEVERLIRDNKIGDFVKIDPPRGQKREAQFGNPARVPPPPPIPKRGYI